ncbi:MAG: DUF4350 domain-containing protein [Myxococcales bacterium]|nr:DUF4350 domain-containing protein [Myxococcales bacterium]
MLRLCLFTAVLVPSAAPPAGADSTRDLDAENTDWNGLSGFAAAARERGFDVVSPTEFDLGSLRSSDALVLIHPTGALPIASLARYLRDGGRMLVADDQGSADTLLGAYGIRRRSPDTAGASLLRGRADLPIASPRENHVLTEGLTGVVTNHPMELTHPALPAILAFDGSDGAVLYAGQVGTGRVLAFSDASLFINNMLAYRDNAVLLDRVLEYVADGRPGRLVLAVGAVEWDGDYGVHGTLRERLRDRMKALLDTELPPNAVRALTITVALVLLLLGSTALPRRSPYRSERMFRVPVLRTGLAARVERTSLEPRARFSAFLAYQEAFESTLRRSGGGTRNAAKVEAFRQRLESVIQSATTGRALRKDEFDSVVAEGEAILRAHEGPPA